MADIGIASEKPPHVTRKGAVLEFDLKPALKIDYAQLGKLKIKVNGIVIDLRTSKDLIADFNRAYRPKVSAYTLMLSEAYAEESSVGIAMSGAAANASFAALEVLDSVDRDVVKPAGELLKNGVRATVNAAQNVYVYGFAKYIRCKEGMDNCPFFDHASTIAERLGPEGYFHGIKEFKCENGKLMEFEALESSNDKKLPSYSLKYSKNSSDIHVFVKNYGHGTEKSNCEYIYNEKSLDLKVVTKDKSICQVFERTGLNTIGYDTLIQNVYRCCVKKSCEEKVLAFKNSYLKGKKSSSVQNVNSNAVSSSAVR